MKEQVVVAIINQKLATHPLLKDVRSPVTIEHSPYNCQRCDEACWIGPKQKIMATLGGYEAVCYICILKDPELASGVLNGEFRGVNPGIENVPRRNGQA